MWTPSLLAALCATTPLAPAQEPHLVSRGLAGYVSMEVEAPPPEFGYGVSLYATAWPLVERPLRDFQIGLASIWIVPDNRTIEEPLLPTGTVARDHWPERGPSYRDVFQTIEGGLGFWASTRFGSTVAKFRMNGTPNGYNHEISSPGFGFGSVQALTAEQMGIAQLSPSLLVPPDGLTFEDGTCGELLGYAWMALPLIEAQTKTAGLDIPTGNQSWTLFLNAKNFKGPVAFYTPATWSRISRRHPPAVGRGLDARPGLVTGGAIEINTVPRFVAEDGKGTTYTRIPRLQFPVDKQGRTVLLHNLTHYSKAALYTDVERWLAGAPPPTGRFATEGAIVPACKAHPLSVRQGEENLPITGAEQWVETRAFDRSTFGLQWKESVLEAWSGQWRRGSFPEYCKRVGKEWVAIRAQAVPQGTGLVKASFPAARVDEVYSSPSFGGSKSGPSERGTSTPPKSATDANSGNSSTSPNTSTSPTSPNTSDDVWHKPGPKAGPFQAKLADGSVVHYAWYRFIDQPALQDADLSAAAKERLQTIVEQMHVKWTPQLEYLPPPGMGTLAGLDPALMVKAPKGLEVGYVPIAIGQSTK